jgi:hypothetical protein
MLASVWDPKNFSAPPRCRAVGREGHYPTIHPSWTSVVELGADLLASASTAYWCESTALADVYEGCTITGVTRPLGTSVSTFKSVDPLAGEARSGCNALDHDLLSSVGTRESVEP